MARITQWKDLLSPVQELKFVGSRYGTRLRRLGILTLKQLLWHLPSRYEDYSKCLPIHEVQPGDQVTVKGCIKRISSRRIFPRRLIVTTVVLHDDTGKINAIWFNQPYIEQYLQPGTFASLAGKAKLSKSGLTISNPQFERLDVVNSSARHTSGLVPIYPETEGVSSKYLRTLIQPLLTLLMLPDPISSGIRKRNGLLGINDALKLAHFPKEQSDITRARHRLAFDELLLFQIQALLARRAIRKEQSASITFDRDYMREWVSKLPFTLTKSQRIAAWEILKDLSKSYPMNRLLEGDVGSGKTIVALLAALNVSRAGYQTVFMVPTEVLAIQHYKTARHLVRDVRIALLTNSRSELNGIQLTKKVLKARISNGKVDIVIGTHAVIQKDVQFRKLALVVVDEQHRFGISQRAALLCSRTTVPHLLSMTATPIPRTLALTIFGDLDISIIKERPKDRKSVITRLVPDSRRQNGYEFIRKQVHAGRQVFVICPRIEIANNRQEGITTEVITKQRRMDELWAEVRAVKDEYSRLSQEIFPDLRVAMLHGRMKPKEKERIMREFAHGHHDILVSTSVVEVGVDVPNTTIMVIENAERFGLAQLHQFRGRVGRSEKQSYCFLFASSDTERLRAMVRSNDGFALAEKDLALRGPGEFFGVKQSGMPDLAMAALADTELIKKARFEARLLLKRDPTLKDFPSLRERLLELERLMHPE